MTRVVFTDFDGTITASETFSNMMKRFAPELSAELIPEMMALRLPLRSGGRRIIESIRSERYSQILESVRGTALRDGLDEFVDARDLDCFVTLQYTGCSVRPPTQAAYDQNR